MSAMAEVQAIRMKRPVHPGAFVKTEIIEPLGLSITAAAQALGVTRPALSALLNERAALSPEMGLRLEKAFGVSMDTLMRMQNSFDIAEARDRADTVNVKPFGQRSEGV
jgi:addiction module HigA family antidote